MSSYSVVHETIFDDEVFSSILKTGLLLPYNINKNLANRITKLKESYSNLVINQSLLLDINNIFDDYKPPQISFSRTNVIYAHLFGQTIDELIYSSQKTLAVAILNTDGVYISDQTLGDLNWKLRNNKIDVQETTHLPKNLINIVIQCAKKYWSEVIPFDEFLSSYEFAPHEESERNWNLKDNFRKTGLAPCFFYPELMYTNNVSPQNLLVISNNR